MVRVMLGRRIMATCYEGGDKNWYVLTNTKVKKTVGHEHKNLKAAFKAFIEHHENEHKI